MITPYKKMRQRNFSWILRYKLITKLSQTTRPSDSQQQQKKKKKRKEKPAKL